MNCLLNCYFDHLGGQCLWRGWWRWPSGWVDCTLWGFCVAAWWVSAFPAHCHRSAALSDGRAVRQTHPWPERSARNDRQQPSQLLESHGRCFYEAQWIGTQRLQQSNTHRVLTAFTPTARLSHITVHSSILLRNANAKGSYIWTNHISLTQE